MLDEKDMTVTKPPVAVRDEEGTLREEFVERVRAPVQALTTGGGAPSQWTGQ
jgi:hypothetical protein